MKSRHIQCQSCGMPLDRDPNGGGTEKDGSLSTKYCSSCYKNGIFVSSGNTIEEMRIVVDNAMKEAGMSWLMRKLARWQIPRLERWKK